MPFEQQDVAVPQTLLQSPLVSPRWYQRSGLMTFVGVILLLALSLWQGIFRYPGISGSVLLAPAGGDMTLDAWLFWGAQFPRVVAALLVGAGLGIAGALMQLTTRNPLVSPDLLGITAGAQFGVMLGLVLPAGFGLPLVFVGGLLAALMTFTFAGGGRTTAMRLVLAGMAMAQILYAILTLLLTLNEHAAFVVAIWDTGSLSQWGWDRVTLAFWLVPPLLLILGLLRRPLNMALLGDNQMQVLGLSPRLLRALIIVIGTLLTAVAIQIAGPLGFIGLVAPNLVRYGFGVRWPSRLIPLAALWGAVLTLFADVLVAALAEVIELPLATLSAILGGVAVMLLLKATQSRTMPGQGAQLGESVADRLPLRPVVALLIAGLLGGLFYGVFAGEYGLSPGALFAGEPMAWQLLDLRLPRLLVDAVGGALFATSGLILQGVTRNPLASPSVLGVSQVAALAVLAGMMLLPEMSAFWRLPFAWGGAMVALAIVILLNVRHGLEPLRLILTGFALTGVATGLTSLLIGFYSLNIAMALIWMSGSSYAVTWTGLWVLAPGLVFGLGLALVGRRWMDLLSLGDGVADSLGVGSARKRLLLLMVASVMIAAAVSVLGPVAFVGLLVPHAVRLLGFHGYRERLLVTPLMGALLLMLADIGGQRLLHPLDIPLGVMTAAIGAPIFLFMLTRTYFRRG